MLIPVPPVAGNTVFLMGEPLLKKYYTAYDSHKERVGFALAARPARDGKPQNYAGDVALVV